jgi:hypothetical protein
MLTKNEKCPVYLQIKNHKNPILHLHSFLLSIPILLFGPNRTALLVPLPISRLTPLLAIANDDTTSTSTKRLTLLLKKPSAATSSIIRKLGECRLPGESGRTLASIEATVKFHDEASNTIAQISSRNRKSNEQRNGQLLINQERRQSIMNLSFNFNLILERTIVDTMQSQ